MSIESDAIREEKDTVSLSGPPEPIVTEDGSVKVIKPRENYNPNANPNRFKTVELGTWICQRCGTETARGLVDGELEEPHECSHCERQGPFKHAGGLGEDDVKAAREAVEMWEPPATISDERYAGLWDDIYNYLWEHWDANEADIYTGLTAYALSTWVRENLTFVPHLMLMAETTGGKTRLLNTLKRVSYRAMVTASATPASMFRLIDDYDVTYYISEYHGLPSESRQQLDNVVRAGQKHGEIITRTEQTTTGYEPKVFDPFSHVAIATQETPADDIVNRCLQIRSSSNDRDMPATHDEETARDIRNRLLYARYRLLDNEEWDEAEQKAYGYLAEKDIDGRTREKLLSLVTVGILWDRLDALEPFVNRVVEQDKEAVADSEEALVLEAIRECAFDEVGDTTITEDTDPFSEIEIPISDVADKYLQMTGTEKDPVSIGHVRSRLGLEKARKGDGIVISDDNLGEKLQELCEEHNLEWERLDTHSIVHERPPEKQNPGINGCEGCGEDRVLTHQRVTDNALLCSQCATEERRNS